MALIYFGIHALVRRAALCQDSRGGCLDMSISKRDVAC
jgi:hypothetical protein